MKGRENTIGAAQFQGQWFSDLAIIVVGRDETVGRLKRSLNRRNDVAVRLSKPSLHTFRLFSRDNVKVRQRSIFCAALLERWPPLIRMLRGKVRKILITFHTIL